MMAVVARVAPLVRWRRDERSFIPSSRNPFPRRLNAPDSIHPADPALAVRGGRVEAQGTPGFIRQRDDVWGVRSEDEAMNAAIARARATLPVFNGYLSRAAGGEVEAIIKAEFHQGDVVEHMWVTDVTFDGRAYHGRLINRPMELTNVRQGDAVTIHPGHVSDWVVVEDGVGLGNFTTLEFRRRMKPAERAEFDRSRHYRIIADSALLALPRR
jgi:uncharacterized protein YegJ (DUF2314 family)